MLQVTLWNVSSDWPVLSHLKGISIIFHLKHIVTPSGAINNEENTCKTRTIMTVTQLQLGDSYRAI